MTPAEAFAHARKTILEHPADFAWPKLDAFNWVDHWFDVYGAERDTPALVVMRDGAGQEATASTETRTWRELVVNSRRVARWLRDHGVERGDRVLLMLGNVVPLWEVVLAAIRLGAVLIPATSQLTSDDVEDRIVRGHAKHMITDAAGAAKLRNPERLTARISVDSAPGFTDYAELLTAPAELEPTPTKASDPLLLYFTSGTTAKPKLVLHTHASYPVGHLSTMYWIGLREGDRHENISSPGWAKHAWSSFFAPWNAGATIIVHDQPRFSAGRAVEVLHSQRVNTLCAPPTVWRMMILADLGKRPADLRELASAGEPLNPEVISAVEEAWKITIRDGYGQTETTAQVGNPPGAVVKLGSMGKPLPGYDVVLLDSKGNEGNDGEVSLKGPHLPLMVGYVDDAERTAAVMANGYYRTGDEATRDADGYIHFVGRGDDVFKSSDYRISPFELESVLVEHPDVAEAAVVPAPDPVRLSVPKAYVTLRPEVTPSPELAKAILAFCKERLAPYKRIRRLEFMTLPKTISGKIRRVELRARTDRTNEHTLE